MQYHSCKRFIIIGNRKVEFVSFVQIVDFEACRKDEGVVVNHAFHLFFHVVFVVDFAKNLFHHVLHGDDARSAAKLVNNGCHALPFLDKVFQKAVGGIGFREEVDAAHEVLQGRLAVIGNGPHHIIEVDVAHDVVDAVRNHDEFGMLGLLKPLLHSLDGIRQLDRLDLVSRSHALTQLHRTKLHHILKQLNLLLHVLVGFLLVGILGDEVVQIDSAELVILIGDFHPQHITDNELRDARVDQYQGIEQTIAKESREGEKRKDGIGINAEQRFGQKLANQQYKQC